MPFINSLLKLTGFSGKAPDAPAPFQDAARRGLSRYMRLPPPPRLSGRRTAVLSPRLSARPLLLAGALAVVLALLVALSWTGGSPTAAQNSGATVTGVALTSTPKADSTYTVGETVRVTLTFGEAVDVTGTPRLKIKMDPSYGEKWANYASGSGTTSLTFAHQVVEPNISTQGVAVLTNTLQLNGGTIKSASSEDNAGLAHQGLGHDASHKVDWRLGAPAVTGVALTSTPNANNTYILGETVQVTLTFGEAVDVSGTPRLKIKMDPSYGQKWANYETGSGTSSLVFGHTVVQPNVSTQGVAVLANTLQLNGGTVRSATGTNALLAHSGLGHDANHKVDWRKSPPLQVSITASATELEVNKKVTLTAVIANAPAGSKPSYKWEMDLGNWHSAGTDATLAYLTKTAESQTFRVTVTYGSEASATSDPITITWVPPNRAPAVDDQADNYAAFVGANNAPRGSLVSKLYAGIFSDPDGDTLTYTVSVPEDRSDLVDSLYVAEATQQVFMQLDDEDDWSAVSPELPDPLVTTVTLTATDPDGLSASLTGEFRTKWTDEFLSVCDRTPQVQAFLEEATGKDCDDITADDLAQVTELDLSNKGLKSLQEGDFDGLSQLRSVNMESNGLTWTDACTDDYGTTVQNINLTNNKLGGTGAAIPDNCFTATKYPNLVSLHLAGNRINALTGDPFDELSALQVLDLSQNQITSLPSGVFHDLDALLKLDLSQNALTSSGLDKHRFIAMVNLEWLSLDKQFVHDPNNNFERTGNPVLTGLDWQVFNGLSNLEDLYLTYNGITSTGLPNNVFSFLTSLNRLFLFGNSGAPFTLTGKGVRDGASVVQTEATPGAFQVEPGDGEIKLSWTDPGSTSISHQRRHNYRTGDVYSDWDGWTDIAASDITTSGGRQEYTFDTGLVSGRDYLFQLRAGSSNSWSWPANPDYSAIFGTSGNDRLVGDFEPDYLTGLAGDDLLIGLEGGDKFDGGDGTDVVSYFGSAPGVTLDLSDGSNNAGDAEGDTFTGIEIFDGSKYEDTLTGDSSSNTLRGNGGDDTLAGGGGNDTLVGDAGDDLIKGGAGGDTLNGGPGDDTLEGGAGNDRLRGEDGIDTASYAASDAGVTTRLAGLTGFVGGHAQGDFPYSIENVIGSAHADTLTGDGNANVLEGLAGGDTLTGSTGVDTVSYASSDAAVTIGLFNNSASGGHAASDTIHGFENVIGSAHADDLSGDGHANVLEGLDGADKLKGRNGSDTASYASSDEAVTVSLVSGGTISGGHAQGDTLDAIENLTGSAHADTLTGDPNANVIEGLAGGDILSGLAGVDTVSYASSPSGVAVNLSFVTASGGHAEGDTLSGFENVTGSAYDDTLTGDTGANVLFGKDGNDTLVGSAGADTMWGEAGNDTVSYAASGSAVTVNFETGAYSGGHAQGDTLGGFEIVIGSDHGDTLTTGSAKAQVLEGGAGADTLTASGSTDGVSYASSPSAVTVNLADNSASGGHAQGDTLSGTFFNLTGSAYDDTLDGPGEGGHVEGGPGDDTLGSGRLSSHVANKFYYFFSGFDDDTVSNHRFLDELRVCIDGATVGRDRTNARTKITVYEPNGNVSGTITVNGSWTEEQVLVPVHSPHDVECQYSPKRAPSEVGKLRVWWTGNTPHVVKGETVNILFLGVDVNKNASAKCQLGNTEFKCPPGTLVNRTPFNEPSNLNTLLTVQGNAKSGDETASAMLQRFHYYGHAVPQMQVSSGDGRVSVSWTAQSSNHATAAINGHQVEYRVVGETGNWFDSGVLAADDTSYDITGLTNGTTYEIRVRTRNDAGDTAANTNWWGPYDYDFATPRGPN